MNSTKKKIILAFSSLATVILVAVIAVVAIFAARNVTVNTGFTINYTAITVKASITGSYKVNTDANATALSPATLTFNGSEKTDGTENVKSFTSVTVSLTAGATETEKYVDFVYVITNNETTNLMDIYLSSDPDTANDNLTYTYSVSLTTNTDATSTGTTYSSLVTGLKPSKSATVTIRVAVADLDQNVDNASGTFAFVLAGVSAS